MIPVRPKNRPFPRKCFTAFLIAIAAGLALPRSATPHPAVQDAEAATHEDAAAMPQVAFEEKTGSLLVRQYQLACLSQFSYLLVSDGVAAVIDPLRDVEVYLKDAEALGAKIRYAILTHSHADFVAGHTELARAVGAEILKSAEGGADFPHRPMKDGDAVELGSAKLAFWATPGHTLDSMTILASVPGAPADPAYAFTGDTLFIGSIGRPDLIGGDLTATVLARKAYGSVQRLRKLPDSTKILPAHGAGSLCGAHLSDETVSTMGAEKLRNPFLRERSEASFVADMISKLPVAPAYFSYNAQLNRKGPPVVDWTEKLPQALPPARVQELAQEGAWVVDVRTRAPYAAGHIPGSVNIAVRGRIGTWAGTIIPHTDPIVLVGSEDEVREAHFRLRRIAYDTVVGYLEGGFEAWKAAGLPVRSTRSMSPKDLHAAIRESREPMIVDVRSPDEFANVRLGGYANIPLAEYRRFGQVLDKTQPVLVVCNSAYRSSLAVGLLERQGFADVGDLEGGMEAWLAASLPVVRGEEGAVAAVGSDAAVPGGSSIFLPEPIEPRALAEAIAVQPELYAIFDIRPEWQASEYRIPGSRLVPLKDLAGQVAALPATIRAVIVDRDGLQAQAAAGALLARLGPEGRTVRVLAGGVARYYAEVELGSARPQATGSAPAAPKAAPSVPAAPAEPARKIRRAGC